MENCRCGVPSASQEVKTPGRNRGRWYWRCPTGSCRFFKWDDSALPFIRHPTEIYAAIAPLDGTSRRPMSLPYGYIRGKEHVLNRTTVKIAFSLISKQLIGMRSQKNLTLDPLIARIRDIQWSEPLSQWTIPATLEHYRDALHSLPHDLPNIILEIEQIPDKVLEGIFSPGQSNHDETELISDEELRWLGFVESPMYRQLNGFQREGVRLGIERRGRILYGNENGLGIQPQALALAAVYRQEWPVLLTCPAVLCDSWYQAIQDFLDLQPSEICLLDHESGVMFQKKKNKNMKSKRSEEINAKRRRISKVLSQSNHDGFRKPYQQRMKEGHLEESSSEEEEVEEEEDEVSRRQSQIKFYIASHKKVSKNKSKLSEQQFKVAICDGSNYLKSKDQNICQNICRVLEGYRRVILLSNKAMHSLPVDLYPQISIVDNQWYPKFETYVQRYCDPKSTVFGLTWNGKSNMFELTELLNKHIWYCPSMKEMREDLGNVVNQDIMLSIIKQPVTNTPSTPTQQDSIDAYMEYVFDTFKRPKIAIAYSDADTIKSVETMLKIRKMKYVHINSLQDATETSEQYDKSNSIQTVLLDLGLERVPIYFERVDLVIVIDKPSSDEFMGYFKTHDRTTPLIVQYLYLPEIHGKTSRLNSGNS